MAGKKNALEMTKSRKPTQRPPTQRPTGRRSTTQRTTTRRVVKQVRRKGLLYQARDAVLGVVGAIQSRFWPSELDQRNNRRRRQSWLPVLLIVAAVGIVILIFVVVRLLTAKNGYEVMLGEQKLGVLALQKEITGEALFDTALKKLESDLGGKVQTEQTVSISPVRAKKKDMVMPDYIVSEIYKNLTYKVQAVSITVDGHEVAVLKNQAEADALLDGIVAQYITEDGKIVESGTSFVETVNVTEVYVDKDRIESAETAHKILTASSEAYDTYTVQSGDSLWSIASQEGMTLDDLLGKNPKYMDSNVLKVGDEITVVSLKPMLSVITVEEVTYTEPEPKPVEKRDNPNEYKTYSKVIQQGQDGQREVTTHITKVNGKETKRELVRTTVTVQPVAEVVEVGTSQTVPKR